MALASFLGSHQWTVDSWGLLIGT